MSLISMARWPTDDAGIPKIDGAESFADLVDKLNQYEGKQLKQAATITKRQSDTSIRPSSSLLASKPSAQANMVAHCIL